MLDENEFDELAFLLDDALVNHILLEAIPERRHHHPRRKRVDRYLMLGELARGGLGQRDDRRLARAIGREFRIALSTRYRRGSDDPAAASLGHHLARSFLCADGTPKALTHMMLLKLSSSTSMKGSG